jgi:hypothetical protein
MLRYSQGEPRCEAAPCCGQRKVKALSIASGILAFVLISGFIYKIPPASAQSKCNYYASPTGTGNGLSPSTPFQISRFWSVAGAGKTLCLLDGIYTGDSSMINPPDNLSGASGNPITIRALNDGKVTINGQGAWQPVTLIRNNYFVLEGFNAHSSGNDSVLRIGASQHNVVRRVAVWDAEDGNEAIVSAGGSEYTLLEDVAAWGVGRKVFSGSQGGNYLTCRRCWGRWERSTYTGPKMVYTLAYNNHHMLVENSIGTWSGEKQPSSYRLQCPGGVTDGSYCGTTMSGVNHPYGIFSADGYSGTPPADSGTRLYGSIAYLRPTDTNVPPHLFDSNIPGNGFNFRDNAAYIPRGSFGNVKPMRYIAHSGSGNLLSATRYTAVGGGAAYQISSTWHPANIYQGSNPPSGSIYTNPTYAKICKRYVNGQLTNEPLWPWPMNQRIKEAMVQSGRAAVDVTQTIEQMFGPIPVECKKDSLGTAKVPAPRNVRVLSIQ